MQKLSADSLAKSSCVTWSPPLPGPRDGQRFTINNLIGSADAAVIAQQALEHRQSFSVMVIICANALDAARLQEEIPVFAPQLSVRLLPDWEILPYDAFSPHQDLVSERLATLHELLTGSCDIVLMPVTTALQKLGPPSFLAAHTFFFKKGDKLDEMALRLQLQQAGYDPVSAVVRPGEYSLRGGLIDLFPMGSALPYRIDLFGDEIDQIRSFDPDSQRSLFPVKEVRLLPGHEFPMDEESRTAFRGRWREVFDGDPSRCSIYKDIGLGIPSAGIESYLPLFFEKSATFFDYLPMAKGPVWLGVHGELEANIKGFWQDTQQRYNFLSHDSSRPVLDPKQLYLENDELFALLKNHPRLVLDKNSSSDEPTFFALPDVSVNRKDVDPISKLKHLVNNTSSRIIISADSAGRRETIRQLLEENQLKAHQTDNLIDFLNGDAKLGITHSEIHDGFVSKQAQLIVITESELFAASARTRRK
ncbi:MAG: transcription-repair coupling factor, partial [Pseudomonadota bacterium]